MTTAFDSTLDPALTVGWVVASTVSAGLSAYHGYKRNESVGMAVLWGVCGSLFPIITPAIAFAQGFGEPEKTRFHALTSSPDDARVELPEHIVHAMASVR